MTPSDEAARLASLKACEILDTPADLRFDLFIQTACKLFGAPIAAISLIDEHRQWFKAQRGLNMDETPREHAFCAHAILRPDEVMVVEDALADPRFADNPLVLGSPHIRTYAGAPFRAPDGQPLGALCVIGWEPGSLDAEALKDLAKGVEAVLALHQSLRDLSRVAATDALTGLANRNLLRRRLERALQQSPPELSCTAFCLDLDRFKPINDGYGHAVGDAVLREAARRLSAASREGDIVARIGGDEFVVVAQGLRDRDEAETLAQRLIDAFAEPFVVEGETIAVGASVGAAMAPKDAADAERLLRAADVALYQAKRGGRRAWRFFNARVESHRLDTPALERDLRKAVEAGDFTLHWQPIVAIQNGAICAREALLRWDRAGHGPISPEVFVPIAETAGLIGRIDAWVLETACRTAAGWSGDQRASINVSSGRLKQPDFARQVRRTLEVTGLEPGRLELEVTEHVLVQDPSRALRIIQQLKNLGVRIALDDFGSGHTSLAYLARYPFDMVKLDARFVGGVGIDPRAEAVLRAIIGLGHDLGMILCAEGVETEAQRAFLAAEGCDLIQGHLVAAAGPLPEQA